MEVMSNLSDDARRLEDCVQTLLAAATIGEGDEGLKSWKHPDKPAAQIDIDHVLRSLLANDTSQAHVQLLEHVVDRFVLILQLSMRLMDTQASGREKGPPDIGVITQTYCELLTRQHQQRQDNTQVSPPPAQEEDAQTELHIANVLDTSLLRENHIGNRTNLRNRDSIRNPQNTANGEVSKSDCRKGCPTCGHKQLRAPAKKAIKYECSICHKCFRLRRYLLAHKKVEHKEKKAEEGVKEKETEERAHSECKDVIKSAVTTVEHECPSCKITFFELRNLQRHMRSQHRVRSLTLKKKPKATKMKPGIDGRFACKDCEKSFKTERILRKHSQIHSGNYTYTCDECGKGYYNVGSFRAHLSVHTGEKYFTCKQCGKGFPHSSSYNFHVRTAHVTVQNFECATCNRKYKSEKYLKDHIQSVHVQPDRYHCTLCGRTFGHRASLFMHMKTHRKDENGGKGKQESSTPVLEVAPMIVDAAVVDRDYSLPVLKQRQYAHPLQATEQHLSAITSSVYVSQLANENASTTSFHPQAYAHFQLPNHSNATGPMKDLTPGASGDGSLQHILMGQQSGQQLQGQEKQGHYNISQAPCSVSYSSTLSAQPTSDLYPPFPWSGGRSGERDFAGNYGMSRSLPPVTLPPAVSTSNAAATAVSVPLQYTYGPTPIPLDIYTIPDEEQPAQQGNNIPSSLPNTRS